MSDVWKDRLYFAARLADSLGLEMGVPSCAGFSATAGPWVPYVSFNNNGLEFKILQTILKIVKGGNAFSPLTLQTRKPM